MACESDLAKINKHVSKADNKAIPPRTKMSMHSKQLQVLHKNTRYIKGGEQVLCLCAGHQARTRPGIPRAENVERTDEFSGNSSSWERCVSKTATKMSRQDVKTITMMIDKVMSGQSSV